MSNATDIYLYLEYLEYYLTGDLDSFHQVCKHVESQEELDKKNNVLVITASGSFIPNPKATQHLLVSSFENTPKYFRSTIPHTLTLFSTIDLVGFLLRNENDYDKTYKNFKAFFQDVYIVVSPEEENVLINIYRHGMSHGYFPKKNLAISYHSTNPQSKLFYKKENDLERIVLNVNCLEKIVTNKLKTVKENMGLYELMGEKYAYLISKYESECNNSIEEVKKTALIIQ